MHLTGDSNDYVGKGLSGGKIIVSPSKESSIVSADNVIIGNVPFYGATSGEAYINGRAGERFGVRNSGANVVVEGVGDHGCEYMTGGRVAILGEVGKNFGAGMSGGIAYVLADNKDEFKNLCNVEMIEFESLVDDQEISFLKDLVQNHFHYTNSAKAGFVLENWNDVLPKFVKVIPKDYKRMMERIDEQMQAGLTSEEAVMSAFEANSKNEKKGSSSKSARSKVVVQ
jgi:glutamate synthase (NADPH/NADH) large chain